VRRRRFTRRERRICPSTLSEDMLVIDTDECLTVELIATFRNHTYGVVRSIHPSNIPALACN
jgi:hypothetical protein